MKMPKFNVDRRKAAISDGLQKVSKWYRKHKPEVKIAVGGGLMAGAVVASSFAGRKTNELLSAKKKETGGEELTKKEVALIVGRTHVPPIRMAIAGGGLIFSGTKDIFKRNAALIGRYNLSIKNFNSYKDAVRKEIGEEQMKVITDKIAGKFEPKKEEKAVEEDTKDKLPRIYYYPQGKILFKIRQTGTFFYATPEAVDKSMLKFNAYLTSVRNASEIVTLTDLLEILKEFGAVGMLNPSTASDSYFWTSVDADIIYRTYNTDQTDKDDYPLIEGVPYNVLEFVTMPRHDEPWG